MNLCKCGCGESVNRTWAIGHCNKNRPRTKKTKQKLSLANKGKKPWNFGFTGKLHVFKCEGCGNIFKSYGRRRYCSRICSDKNISSWNKGMTKQDNKIVSASSSRMKNPDVQKKMQKSGRKKLYLPNLKKYITYDKKSELEKTWLLKSDNTKGVVAIYECDFVIPYVDSKGVDHFYHPDYTLEWETGLKWIVEVKGWINDYERIKTKFIYASDWCRDNGFDYRLISKGIIKTDTWSEVYLSVKDKSQKYKRIPSLQWLMMHHAVICSCMSPSFRLEAGCVICDSEYNNILSFGFNGDERGGANAPLRITPGGEEFVHAEENALIKLQTDKACVMFLTHMPCILCAKKIINSQKIKEVYYLESYRDPSGVGLLIKSGIPVYRFQIYDNDGSVLSSKEARDDLRYGISICSQSPS